MYMYIYVYICIGCSVQVIDFGLAAIVNEAAEPPHASRASAADFPRAWHRRRPEAGS